jgi:hypothetical protein
LKEGKRSDLKRGKMKFETGLRKGRGEGGAGHYLGGIEYGYIMVVLYGDST